MKILAIGDLHLKPKLGYADYISDKREGEKQKILDVIVRIGKDCDTVVFLGDQLNSKNNSSDVIREFTELIERFKDKEVYILAGNHCKYPDGRTALDYLKEIDKPNWNVVTTDILHVNDITFCPYFYVSELDEEENEKAIAKLMKKLKGGNILFHHHAVAGTFTEGGTSTSIFDEIVLPRQELEKKYKKVIGGHIHRPQDIENTIVAGSIFCNEVGEHQKYVYTVDTEKLEVTPFPLPGRGIYKLTDPTEADIKKIKKGNIVKVELTKKTSAKKLSELKETLVGKFDAYVLLENYPTERQKVHFEEGMLDFSIDKLLEEYAKTQKLAKDKLLKAWSLIK